MNRIAVAEVCICSIHSSWGNGWFKLGNNLQRAIVAEQVLDYVSGSKTPIGMQPMDGTTTAKECKEIIRICYDWLDYYGDDVFIMVKMSKPAQMPAPVHNELPQYNPQ